MKSKVIVTSVALTLASSLSAFAACSGHSQQAMTCAEGTSWDSESRSCVPTTS
ncbi:carbohydrate-binding module family 14 protein [Roseovarius aestuariivivens]|uniref:carbohydrate-binding module family 14 protein n=1 Tax=Roseovarius aestuariivivens TaxID=1888910 RepID=UPI001080B7DB|nr:carbohydrate-binding module family 14 protein [Roseovarius aestuariivivens]